MRCGKTDELVDWVVDSIIEDPSRALMVMTANPSDGREVMSRIQHRLREDHEKAVEEWRFTPWRIRTSKHGHVELFASRRDRVVRGYSFDEVLASDECDPRILDSARWSESHTGEASPE